MVSSSKLFEVFITFPFDNFSLVLFKIRADAYNHKDRSRSIIPKKTVTVCRTVQAIFFRNNTSTNFNKSSHTTFISRYRKFRPLQGKLIKNAR